MESGIVHESYHRAVLLKESVDALNIQPDGIYVDVTMGAAGHTNEILSRLTLSLIHI